MQGKGVKGDILRRILRTKREEVAGLERRGDELRSQARDRPPPRDFREALSEGGTVSVIAEVKRRSPGAGPIRPGLDPAALAKRYQEGGARALSVLTDREYFGGDLQDLDRARQAVRLPALRKDFTLHPIQIWEARAAGADAVLLIVRALEDGPLQELRLLAEELQMSALVEVHDARELDRALESGASIVGVNNRDLRTFTTSLQVTLDLLPSIPPECVLVSESGIRSGEDVERLGAAGVDAVLVGESLLRSEDPMRAVTELAGKGSVARSHA